MSARRLLFIHYEENQLAAGSAALRQAGYRVEGAKNLLGALRWLSYDPFDLIVIGESVLKSQLALVLDQEIAREQPIGIGGERRIETGARTGTLEV